MMVQRPADPAPPLRIRIALSCSVCSARNYKTTKSAREGAPPIRLKKFCKFCNEHTVHHESK